MLREIVNDFKKMDVWEMVMTAFIIIAAGSYMYGICGETVRACVAPHQQVSQ